MSRDDDTLPLTDTDSHGNMEVQRGMDRHQADLSMHSVTFDDVSPSKQDGGKFPRKYQDGFAQLLSSAGIIG